MSFLDLFARRVGLTPPGRSSSLTTKPRVFVLSSIPAILSIIVRHPGLVIVWAIFSLAIGLVRSFASFLMAQGSQARFDAMDKWSPLTDLTGADLPLPARLVLPALMLVSIAFYQTTLNRAVMPTVKRGAGGARPWAGAAMGFASIAAVYVTIASLSWATGPLLNLGWAAAKMPFMDGIDVLAGFVLSCVLLAKLSLVSPAAYDTGKLGFAASWHLTRGYGRAIFLVLIICWLAATMMVITITAARWQLLTVLNGDRGAAPIQRSVASLELFLRSSGLKWDLVQSTLTALFWPIVLAPLSVIYVRLAGREVASPSSASAGLGRGGGTPSRNPGRATATWVVIGAVVLAVGVLASSWWGQMGKGLGEGFSRTLTCSDLQDPTAAARAIADCGTALNSRNVTNGERAQLLRYRGEDYRDEGDYAHALADLVRSDKLAPGDADTLENLGEVHGAMGDSVSALADYKRLFSVAPTFVSVVGSNCVEQSQEGKQLAEARADCDAILSLRPRDPDALEGRALVNYKQSRFQEAWNDFNAAVRAQPGDFRHRYGRGLAALRVGRTPEGRADLAAALKGDPGVVQTFAGYGL